MKALTPDELRAKMEARALRCGGLRAWARLLGANHGEISRALKRGTPSPRMAKDLRVEFVGAWQEKK